jgi:hypothetical protein
MSAPDPAGPYPEFSRYIGSGVVLFCRLGDTANRFENGIVLCHPHPYPGTRMATWGYQGASEK